jgi:uncharacterized membrane protein (UPF0127 family)
MRLDQVHRIMHLLNRLVLALLLLVAVAGAHAQNSEITLSIAGHKLRAEVVATHDTRSQGLMYREHLEANRGMLFVFPGVAPQSMWMMNTLIPLSVAFIGSDGRILNILDMSPQTLDIHSSEGPAAFALEMNRGWFAQRGIGRGARVEGLDAAPSPD